MDLQECGNESRGGIRLEFSGSLRGCSSRLTFTKTAICRPACNHVDTFESRKTKKRSFRGRIAGAQLRGNIRFALAFWMAFCYEVNPINIEDKLLPYFTTQTEQPK